MINASCENKWGQAGSCGRAVGTHLPHSSAHKGVFPLFVPLFPSTDPPALFCPCSPLFIGTPLALSPVQCQDQCRETGGASWHSCQGTRGVSCTPWPEGKAELQPLLRCETRGTDALQMKRNHPWFHFLSHSRCALFPSHPAGTAHGKEAAQKRFC